MNRPDEHLKAGFLFDASAPNQRMFWIGAVEAIARVHRLDAPHFATVGPTVASHLTWAEALCSWAGIDHPVVMSTYESLRRSMPPEDAVAPCFLWATRDPPISHRKPPFAYVRAF